MLERLVTVMARLRDPAQGCTWDLAQTWQSIVSYTIEEAYEVADAIARDDIVDLKDELGDLLLQVVFHSRIAEERSAFTIADVVTAICDKMERRHPQMFSGLAIHTDWETSKAAERDAKGRNGALDGVALALPALARADKLQKRAARTGFDWPDVSGPRAKIDEELAEIEAADDDHRAEEVGDLLFSVVNWARHLGIDPEDALRHANAKFERRFACMEAQAGASFAALDLTEKEGLWDAVKRRGG